MTRVGARPDPLGAHERLRASTAAGHARTRYPGPAGELIAREIEAYAHHGYRGDQTALIPRLIGDLMRPAREAPTPTDLTGEAA